MPCSVNPARRYEASERVGLITDSKGRVGESMLPHVVVDPLALSLLLSRLSTCGVSAVCTARLPRARGLDILRLPNGSLLKSFRTAYGRLLEPILAP